MTPKQVAAIVLTVVLVIFSIGGLGSIVESLDATEIMVIQSPFTGKLTWHTSPGVKWQGFGKVTKYHKRAQYWFSKDHDDSQPIKIRFNDGAHADVTGSIAWEIPLAEDKLNALHSRYGTQAAVDNQLIRTAVDKSVYFSGPTMSSKESYSDRRNELIHIIGDQVNHGVYQTSSSQRKEKDALSGQDKTVTVAEIVKDSKTGEPLRQETSPLQEFGIRAFNLAINSVDYEKTVEAQIQQQQTAIMEVQTAMATAKKAEQAAITAEKEGEAAAAKAKWEQEVIKAKAVTEAEQKLRVAELSAKEAEQEKRKQILLGEGESERRKLVMAADGALQVKVDAWLESQKIWANAFSNYKGALVPSVTMGNASSQNGVGTVQQFMEILGAKAAKDLAVEVQAKPAQK